MPATADIAAPSMRTNNREKPRLPRALALLTGLMLATLLSSCQSPPDQTLVTIADARSHPASLVDTGTPGDSTGDILSFDQPLLNQTGETIGNNSGFCIRTRVAHHFQCQWTLTFANGSIQVAGRESDHGESSLAIVGGTGIYARIRGEMISRNNGDSTFTQTLHYQSGR